MCTQVFDRFIRQVDEPWNYWKNVHMNLCEKSVKKY